ncbi:MAG TPA: HAD family hydrolase [Myxococcota bacterium]|nr:HAD family hydrolase [Myxococcota bacterium]
MPRLSLSSLELDLDAVLFDAGGTLLRLDYAFMRTCAARRNHAIDDDALARGEATVRREIDRRAARTGGPRDRDADRVAGYFHAVLESAGVAPAAAEAAAGELAAEHARANLWRVAMPGAAAALAALRARGFRVGVVSNADGRVAALLEAAGLAPHLETIVDSHHEGVEKPDPEIFRRALARLGVPAERTAYVGDIFAIDVLGARAAGLAAILIDETGGYADADCPRIAALADLLA